MKTCVVGKGIVGLCVALRCSEQGQSVQIIYDDDGASRIATGVSTVKGLRIPDYPLFTAKLMGHEHLRGIICELEDFYGVKISGDGVFEYYSSAEEHSKISNRVKRNVLLESIIEKEDHFYYPQDFYFQVPQFLDLFEGYLKEKYKVSFRKGVVVEYKSHPEKTLRLQDDVEICFENLLFCMGHRVMDFFPSLSPRWKITSGWIVEQKTLDADKAVVKGSRGSVSINGRKRTGSFASEDDLDSVDGHVLSGFRCLDKKEGLSYFEIDSGVWILGGVHKSGFQLADVIARRVAKQLSLLSP